MTIHTITALGIVGKNDGVFRRICHIPISSNIRRTQVSKDYYRVMFQMNDTIDVRVVRKDRITKRELSRISPHWDNLGSLVAT